MSLAWEGDISRVLYRIKSLILLVDKSSAQIQINVQGSSLLLVQVFSIQILFWVGDEKTPISPTQLTHQFLPEHGRVSFFPILNSQYTWVSHPPVNFFSIHSFLTCTGVRYGILLPDSCPTLLPLFLKLHSWLTSFPFGLIFLKMELRSFGSLRLEKILKERITVSASGSNINKKISHLHCRANFS